MSEGVRSAPVSQRSPTAAGPGSTAPAGALNCAKQSPWAYFAQPTTGPVCSTWVKNTCRQDW